MCFRCILRTTSILPVDTGPVPTPTTILWYEIPRISAAILLLLLPYCCCHTAAAAAAVYQVCRIRFTVAVSRILDAAVLPGFVHRLRIRSPHHILVVVPVLSPPFFPPLAFRFLPFFSSLSLLLSPSSDPRSHIVAASPPSLRFVPCTFTGRRLEPFLSSSTGV